MRSGVPKTYTTLQMGRGIAALAVLLYHENVYFSAYMSYEPIKILRAGNAGVWFFFVLSGAIMVLAHRDWFGHREKLRTYL